MNKDVLVSYVEEGLSTYKIAKLENKAPSTITYWLKKYNLKTKNKSFKDGYFKDNRLDKNNQFCSWCEVKLNDENSYYRKDKGIYHPYCKTCISSLSKKERENNKKIALEYNGIFCSNCGYDTCINALEFHHLDPTLKEDNLSKILRIKNINDEKIKEELDKCIVLCSNCHREEHFRIDNKREMEKEFNKFNVSSLTNCINTGKNTENPSCKKCDVVLTDENLASKHHYPICKQCNSKRAMKREKDGKQRAVDYMGGCCSVCGYDKCIRALEFHHIDPDKKSKDYNKRFKVWSFERQKKELENCIIVCSNCHREIHSRDEWKQT